MIRDKITLQKFIALICLPIILIACSPEPEPISQVTLVPEGVEIISIDEGQIVISEISQQKIFDQCESSSPFKAEVRFSQSSGQESQNDLVFKGNISGEIGLSEIAKVQVGSAIEKRFTNTNTSGQAHDEGVAIEVPAHTKQEYTIVWQEIRRDGKVEYIEDGETATVDYSYRIGVELSSSTVVDLECPEQEILEKTENPILTPNPTSTPYPTATQLSPTITNTPVPLPTNTPPDSILTVGEKWYTEGRELMLNNYKFESTRIRFEIRFTNRTENTIIFDISTESFVITDNLGQRYTASYPLGCGSGGAYDLTLTLESGATKDCNVYFNSVDYANLQVNQLIFSATASVIQNARWQIPIQH